jgi:hypothetical protein
MKNDEQEVNPQPQSSNIESSGATAEPLANNNGHQTHEPEREGAGEAGGKRTVSARKIEANRRNAGKGTGPKTAAGKKRVSQNAIKHGFFSKYLLVQHRDGKESQGEYDDFYAGIRKEFQPVGWLGWKRLLYGPGGFAGSCVVRPVRLIELSPRIATRSSNQKATIWQNRSLHHGVRRKWMGCRIISFCQRKTNWTSCCDMKL